MSEETQVIRSASKLGTFLGILTVVLGMLAIGSPFVSGVAVATVVGILLLVSGINQAVFAFKSCCFSQGLFAFLFGAISVVAGGVMVAKPLLGLATLTMVLVIYFAVDGIASVVTALQHRPAQGWGWLAFSGVASLLLAVLFGRHWPLSGVWAIGTLVGVRLLLTGWAMIFLGSAGRTLAREVEAAS